jgi:glyoxylase-like metal-dependent hydrolase (beta-lactamase superfamily II)
MGRGEIAIQSFTGGAFGQNTLLVACARTGAAILVDPGAATPQLLRAIRAGEYHVEQIVLTHAHLDHVEGVAEAKRQTGAPVLLHPADQPLYDGAPQQAEWFGMRLEPLPPVDGFLAAGEAVRFGECELAVRFTPGHAPGDPGG